MDLKKAKIISIVLLGIFAVLMAAMALATDTAFGYAAIAVMGIYGVFQLLFWRCPYCGKNLGPLWVKCCPNCGGKLQGGSL